MIAKLRIGKSLQNNFLWIINGVKIWKEIRDCISLLQNSANS